VEPCFKLSKRAVYLSNESISAFTIEQQVEIEFFWAMTRMTFSLTHVIL